MDYTQDQLKDNFFVKYIQNAFLSCSSLFQMFKFLILPIE